MTRRRMISSWFTQPDTIEVLEVTPEESHAIIQLRVNCYGRAELRLAERNDEADQNQLHLSRAVEMCQFGSLKCQLQNHPTAPSANRLTSSLRLRVDRHMTFALHCNA